MNWQMNTKNEKVNFAEIIHAQFGHANGVQLKLLHESSKYRDPKLLI